MRVSISRHPQCFDIEFDQDLPLFPEPNRPRYSSRGDYVFSRDLNLDAYASQMAAANAGVIPVELPGEPRLAYREFLTELVTIPGLVGIFSANRYCLRIHAGRHFETARMASQLAAVIHRWFYPDQDANYTVLDSSGEVVEQR